MAKKHLKQVLLQLDPEKPREKDVMLTLERLKSKGISHKAAVIEALTIFETQHDPAIAALTQKSDVILEHVQAIKDLFLRAVQQTCPAEACFETIGVSNETITADEINNF